ncbi:MAG: transcriptional regulator MarR family [Acidimicrobiales bacterium]|nr:transcriptional regulator MarR family [Acidimicrobiales bacterium]
MDNTWTSQGNVAGRRDLPIYNGDVADLCTNHPVGMLLAVAERIQSHLDATARAVGITHAQVKVLMQLDQPQRLCDLASLQDCDPSSITALVQRLERDCLVQREVDPNDGRARRIRITAKGKRLRQKFLELMGDGRAALDTLSVEQRTALAAMIAGG